ncbi:MAG TPA: Sec-independent protein translocase protein TatB [Burkholderiales bacterium]|nr:Sec-independent protein translocase protein TatB [Burkholderiales bacterium]
MFEIGFSELVLIGVLALLVLGPKRLPEVARAAGTALAKLRRFVTNVKQDFNTELHSAELAELRKLKSELDETRRTISDSGARMVQDLADADTQRSFPHPDSPVTGPIAIAPPLTEPPVKKRRKSVRKTNGRRNKTTRKRR